VTVVLAVDPGGTSGWAQARIDSAEQLKQTLTRGQLPPSEAANLLRNFCLHARRQLALGSTEAYVLVMERFTITAQTGKMSAQYDALELIGLGRYLAEWSDVEFDVSQAPGDAKSFAHNDALRRWGIWVPSEEHARDAVRHLVLKAAKQGVYLE
jgi:hypothetical protein